MEYLEHNVVSQDVQMQLVNSYKAAKGTEWFFFLQKNKFCLQTFSSIEFPILGTSEIVGDNSNYMVS